MGVKKYVGLVEDIIIDTCADYGVETQKIDGMTGVFLGLDKIAAIGIRVTKWTTYHGFALNVETDLSLFDGIIPCGISDKGVTRMIDINTEAKVENVKKTIIGKFQKVFGFDEVVEK
jgi:lipoyl(octanoyl) transferase